MTTGNGEFRGKAKSDIEHLQADVKEIKERLISIEAKLDDSRESITALKTQAAIWGGISGFVITASLSIILTII